MDLIGRHFFLAAALVLNMPAAFSSQVVPSSIEEVAGRIQTVLKVKVTDVTQTENRMKLKDGTQGPVMGFEKTITADVITELVGRVDATTITARYYMPVLAKYDDEGNVELTYSIQIPGTALEYSIEKDQEYIFCFGPASAGQWENGAVELMRAEKPEMESAVVAAVKKARNE
jgi:hypothetical protein